MSATPEQEAAYQDALKWTARVGRHLEHLVKSRREKSEVIGQALNKCVDLIHFLNISTQQPIRGVLEEVAGIDDSIAKLTALGDRYAAIIAGYEYERLVERAVAHRPKVKARTPIVVRDKKPPREPVKAKRERVTVTPLHSKYRTPAAPTVRMRSEDEDIRLPAPVVEVERIPSVGMPVLCEDIRARGVATEHWAPWERRRWGVSRRYEGFRRMRELA